MDFGTFGPPEVTHYFGNKHTHDSDHAECPEVLPTNPVRLSVHRNKKCFVFHALMELEIFGMMMYH